MQAASSLRHAIIALCAALFCLSSSGVASVAAAVFRPLPDLEREQLLERYAPLRRKLKARLGPIALLSAPDARALLARLEAAAWDLVLAPPHVLAQAAPSCGHLPVGQLNCPPEMVFLPRANSDIDRPNGLLGRTVLLPDPFALLALLADRFLETMGLAVRMRFGRMGRLFPLLAQLPDGLVDAVFLPQSSVDAACGTPPLSPIVSFPSPVPLSPVLFTHPRIPAALPALRPITSMIQTDPDSWSVLFPGPPLRALVSNLRDLEEAASLRDLASARTSA